MRVAVLVSLCLALPAARAGAQADPEEQARRLLQDGQGYRAEGKHKQALDNFNTVVNGFPESSSVDDALLEIGRYYVEVEADVDKGRAAFEQVTQRFPQSDGAPGAYYYLGWITLRGAVSREALDDAEAQFDRVQRLYPGSEWVPRAMYASGLVARRAGRYEPAALLQRRVAMEYPTSDVAAAAQLEVGHCLALFGQPQQAMEEYQQVRNRFPASAQAERALDRITALWRLHGSERPVFRPDPAFAPASGDVLKDVRALLVDPDGTLWIASDKVKAVVPVAPDGKPGSPRRGEELRSLALAPDGQLIAAARRAVRLGERDIKSFAAPVKPGELQELDHILAAVRTPSGSLLVSDEKSRRIHRYDADFAYQGSFPDGREREATRLLLDGEGGIVVLDARARSVEVYDEAGKRLRAVALRGPGYEIKKPVDVAVDAFLNLYVADEQEGVFVFAQKGELVARVGTEALSRVRALALDRSGAVLVYDDRQGRILRFE